MKIWNYLKLERSASFNTCIRICISDGGGGGSFYTLGCLASTPPPPPAPTKKLVTLMLRLKLPNEHRKLQLMKTSINKIFKFIFLKRLNLSNKHRKLQLVKIYSCVFKCIASFSWKNACCSLFVRCDILLTIGRFCYANWMSNSLNLGIIIA